MVCSLVCSIAAIALNDYFPELTTTIKETVASINFYQVFMKVFLGFILFAGAFKISYDELKKELKPVIALALISTLISSFIVAALTWELFRILGFDVPFLHCLLFGALISPTDPVAVLGILKKAGVSTSLEMKVTGESLFNDSIAIVLFMATYEVATLQKEASIADVSLLFLREAGGGIVLGFILALAGFIVLKFVDDYKIEILITLVIVMIGYSIADSVNVSAPIAIVIAGLFTGTASKKYGMSAESQKYVSIFWELVDDFLNIILFILIGFELMVIPFNWYSYVIGLTAIVIVLIARYISVIFPVLIFRRWFEKNAAVMLTWCGLRGAVSIALALAIPVNMHRSSFVIITYVVAVFSIIVQGLTIKRLAKRLKLKR
jgi:CPA1 family monovalent cation:H+ antiporter